MATHKALALLDQVHGAILQADFRTLDALSAAMEASLSDAAQLNDAALLGRIRAKAERNAACLQAAGRGVRAAQRRLAEMQSAGQGFSTYDGRGKRALHAMPTSFALRY